MHGGRSTLEEEFVMTWIDRMAALAALALAGCGTMFASHPPEATDAVVRQASFDLACPAEQLQVVPINFRSYGASGCGRHASYTAACGLVGCAALVNGSPAENAQLQAEREEAQRVAQQ